MKKPGAFPVIAALALLLPASLLVSLLLGTERLPPADILTALARSLGISSSAAAPENQEYIRYIVMDLRLPRAIVAALVGAGLAVSGCCLQGLFNNPLAAPDVLGLTSGGALGAVLAIFLGLDSVSLAAVPVGAFIGALGTGLLVYTIATHHGRTPIATLLLAGIAMNAMLGAVVSLLLTLRIDNIEMARRIVYWLIGGLDNRLWDHVRMATIPILGSLAFALFVGRDLNSLTLGDETARSLGVPVERFRVEILVLVSVAAGASVAVCGVLGFVGLIVPHIFRLLVGPDHRRLIPVSALGGAVFLVFLDIVSRTLIRPAEIKVGILTALLGGPFFLFLLLRNLRKLGVV